MVKIVWVINFILLVGSTFIVVDVIIFMLIFISINSSNKWVIDLTKGIHIASAEASKRNLNLYANV